MDHSDYKQLQTAWDAIERLEHLESLVNKREHISFMAQIAPTTIAMLPCNQSSFFALTPDMNRIVMEALMAYKEELKTRMAAIELNDTTASPIED